MFILASPVCHVAGTSTLVEASPPLTGTRKGGRREAGWSGKAEKEWAEMGETWNRWRKKRRRRRRRRKRSWWRRKRRRRRSNRKMRIYKRRKKTRKRKRRQRESFGRDSKGWRGRAMVLKKDMK